MPKSIPTDSPVTLDMVSLFLLPAGGVAFENGIFGLSGVFGVLAPRQRLLR